jgi:hypothetical protein
MQSVAKKRKKETSIHIYKKKRKRKKDTMSKKRVFFFVDIESVQYHGIGLPTSRLPIYQNRGIDAIKKIREEPSCGRL